MGKGKGKRKGCRRGSREDSGWLPAGRVYSLDAPSYTQKMTDTDGDQN